MDVAETALWVKLLGSPPPAGQTGPGRVALSSGKMATRSSVGAASLAALVAAAAVPAVAAPPLNERHTRWLQHDVGAIVSDVERRAFHELPDEAARDRFIVAFWQARDPTVGTARNEYRDEHYRRLEQADDMFRHGKTRGSETARGQIWIRLGPPGHRTRYPAEARLYPIEHWFYQVPADEDLPRFFNLLFYQPYGAGDYELYDPIADGPEKLVGGFLARRSEQRRSPGRSGSGDGRGGSGARLSGRSRFQRDDRSDSLRQRALRSLRQVDPELARVSLSPIPGDPVDLHNGTVLPSVGLVFAQLADYANRQPVDFGYAERLLEGRVEIEYEFHDLGMQAYFLGALSGGRTGLHYAVEIPPESLTLKRYRDHAGGSLHVVGRVFRASDAEPVQQIDEQIDLAMSTDELQRLRRHPLAVEDVIALPPGSYTIDLVVRDRLAKRFGSVAGRFRVPEAAPEGRRLQLSTVLLATRSHPVAVDGAAEVALPFAFAGWRYYPAVNGRVSRHGALEAVVQVSGAPASGAIELTAAVLPDGARQPVWTHAETAVGAGGEDGAVTTWTAQVPVAELAAGDYQLRVEAGHGDDRTARRVSFAITDEPPAPAPWLAIDRRAEAAAAPPDHAAGLLRLAVERLKQGRYQDAGELVSTLAASDAPPPLALLVLGLARSGTGDSNGAIAAFEQGVAREPSNTRLWNALGEEHRRTGDTDKAVAAFERSLAVEPDQLHIRATVTELTDR